MQITTATPYIPFGGGGTQQSSIQGGSALRSNPYTIQQRNGKLLDSKAK